MPDLESASTISARGLSRSFGSHVAVNNITLELKRGEVLGLLGPNGAGKTTTMQMLTGNLAPSSGAISICGIDLFDEPIAAKARIGYLPEVPPLYRELTVDEYLILAAKLHRVPRASRADAIAAAKQRCGLTDSGRKLIGTLSKGYQQRVGIAQAIVHRPDVVILDEPTIGLDPNQIREIRGIDPRARRRAQRDPVDAHPAGGRSGVRPRADHASWQHRLQRYDRRAQADPQRQHGARRSAPAAAARRACRGAGGRVGGERRAHVVPRPVRRAAAMPPTRWSQQAAARDWGLYQLNSAQTSLEDVFVNSHPQREEKP